MRNQKFTISVVAAVIASLSGCASNLSPFAKAQYDAAPVDAISQRLPDASYGTNGRIINRGDDLRSMRVVRHSSYPYIGGKMVASTNEDALPAVFYENYALDFGQGRTSLAVVATRLTKLTGVPVRLRTDVLRGSGQFGGAIASPAGFMPSPLPPGATVPPGRDVASSGRPMTAPFAPSPIPSSAISSDSVISVDAVNMKWNGKLRDFLDHLTNNLGLAWEYRDGAVVIMKMVSETYELASFNGHQKYAMSTGGTGTGSSGGTGSSQSTSASMNVSQAGEGDSRKSIIATIQSMVASVPGSTVNISDGTGRIVVVTSKDVQAQVRDYIKSENKSLRQMVNVTFDVYSLRTNDSDTQGINWNVVYSGLASRAGVNIKSPSTLNGADSGTVGVSIISGLFAGSSAVIALLRQFGTSVQHRPVTVTTLNGIWDTKTRLNTEGYLKETTPGVASSSGAAGAPGLKTDTITTGDQFAVLPMVMQDNSVMVKYSIGLSDNLGFTDVSTGSGATLQKVQTPHIEANNANSTIVLAPGETAVITGLSRLIATSSENRLTESMPVALGGSRKLNLQREHFLVLVRATPL